MKIIGSLIIYILIIAVIILLGWQKTKLLLYQLMLQAKRLAKEAILKSGQQQEEWVVRKALQFLPRALIIFISETNIRKIIRWLYTKAKDYCDDGKLNNSISA